MNICFFGVGGVGGYFGGLAAHYLGKEHNIYYVARGAHKEAICQNGLMLKKNGGEELLIVKPALCTDNVDDLPICDIVVVSVKSYDLDAVSKLLDGITADHSMVLPLLNGVDIYERIRKYYRKGQVLPACVYVGTHIESPGVIRQEGGNCRILCGSDPLQPQASIDPLLNLFSEAHISMEKREDVQVAIWSKYMFIAAFGLVAATFRKTLGEVLADPELKRATLQVMLEIQALANAKHVVLPVNIVETSLNKALEFPFTVKTSYQRDVESPGKQNEGDLFGGTLLRMGAELGIPVEETRRLYNQLSQECNS